jgi:hypothetical protein
VALAVRTGIPPADWLEDTRAMVTAIDLLNDEARRRR